MRDVTGRMVDHPFRATGPLMSLPDSSRPMKLQAGSWRMRMSNSAAKLFSNWIVVCFLRWILSWVILIGCVEIGVRPFMVPLESGVLAQLSVVEDLWPLTWLVG